MKAPPERDRLELVVLLLLSLLRDEELRADASCDLDWSVDSLLVCALTKDLPALMYHLDVGISFLLSHLSVLNCCVGVK